MKRIEGLTMQRSKNRDDVKERYRQQPRLTGTRWKVKFDHEATGVKTMSELVTWLKQKDLLNERYNYIANNCQHFGNRVFNFLAGKKIL